MSSVRFYDGKLCRYITMYTPLITLQHFIQDCPERPIPKEGFICKLCNEVRSFFRTRLEICPIIFSSLATLSATAPRSTQSATPAVASPSPATCAVLAEARTTISRIVHRGGAALDMAGEVGQEEEEERRLQEVHILTVHVLISSLI